MNFYKTSKTKKLAKSLLFSATMLHSAILLPSIIAITSISTDEVMADSQGLFEVDLTTGEGKIISNCINDNINAKASLLKVKGILEDMLKDEKDYWAQEAIEDKKNKWYSSIVNLKKLCKLAKDHTNEQGRKISENLVNKIRKSIIENGGKVNDKNKTIVFGLANGFIVYNSLYDIYHEDWRDKGKKSLSKNGLKDLFANQYAYLINKLKEEEFEVCDEKGNERTLTLKDVILSLFDKNGEYRDTKLWEHKTINGDDLFDASEYTFDGDKTKYKRLAGYLKHDWDCYLTQFGVICDIEDNKNKVKAESVIKTLHLKQLEKEKERKVQLMREIFQDNNNWKTVKRSLGTDDVSYIYNIISGLFFTQLSLGPQQDVENALLNICTYINKSEFEENFCDGKRIDQDTWLEFLKKTIKSLIYDTDSTTKCVTNFIEKKYAKCKNVGMLTNILKNIVTNQKRINEESKNKKENSNTMNDMNDQYHKVNTTTKNNDLNDLEIEKAYKSDFILKSDLSRSPEKIATYLAQKRKSDQEQGYKNSEKSNGWDYSNTNDFITNVAWSDKTYDMLYNRIVNALEKSGKKLLQSDKNKLAQALKNVRNGIGAEKYVNPKYVDISDENNWLYKIINDVSQNTKMDTGYYLNLSATDCILAIGDICLNLEKGYHTDSVIAKLNDYKKFKAEVDKRIKQYKENAHKNKEQKLNAILDKIHDKIYDPDFLNDKDNDKDLEELEKLQYEPGD